MTEKNKKIVKQKNKKRSVEKPSPHQPSLWSEEPLPINMVPNPSGIFEKRDPAGWPLYEEYLRSEGRYHREISQELYERMRGLCNPPTARNDAYLAELHAVDSTVKLELLPYDRHNAPREIVEHAVLLHPRAISPNPHKPVYPVDFDISRQRFYWDGQPNLNVDGSGYRIFKYFEKAAVRERVALSPVVMTALPAPEPEPDIAPEDLEDVVFQAVANLD
jgi:hypothetical protein